MNQTTFDRGYTLVVVIVLLAILMLLGAGAVRMAGDGARGAIANRTSISVTACARAARDAMKSQIRFMSSIPESFEVTLVSDDGTELQAIESGHREGLQSQANIEAVEFLSDSALGTGRSPSLHPRISNDILPASQSSSSAVRVVAICRDEVGRTQEVEFLLRYGL